MGARAQQVHHKCTVSKSTSRAEDLSALNVDIDLDVKVAIISKEASSKISVQSPVPTGPVKPSDPGLG